MISHDATSYRIVYWKSGSGNHKEAWTYQDRATDRCKELETLGALDIRLYRVDVTELLINPPDPSIAAHFERQGATRS